VAVHLPPEVRSFAQMKHSQSCSPHLMSDPTDG
jgi:hypothetical protein